MVNSLVLICALTVVAKTVIHPSREAYTNIEGTELFIHTVPTSVPPLRYLWLLIRPIQEDQTRGQYKEKGQADLWYPMYHMGSLPSPLLRPLHLPENALIQQTSKFCLSFQISTTPTRCSTHSGLSAIMTIMFDRISNGWQVFAHTSRESLTACVWIPWNTEFGVTAG